MNDYIRSVHADALIRYVLDDSDINAERLAAATLTLHLYENRDLYSYLPDHLILSILRGYRRQNPAVRP